MSSVERRKGFEALVADDDPGVRDLLVDFLSDRGLQVGSAVDGRAAVTALERSEGRCRLIFADISMPGADGFAVLTAARQVNPLAYVVMMTGYGTLDSAINAVRLGAQDYLTKPFSLGQVDVILRQASARQALEHGNSRLADPSLTATLTRIENRLAVMEEALASLARVTSR
jgi:DNA-binding NtrC family response regulator